MKKRGRIFLGVIIFIAAVSVAGSITGLLRMYKMPAPTNEPAIKESALIFVSSLGRPAPYKFAVFTSQYHDSLMSSFDENYKQGSKYIYRICGMPGDIVEMKDGVLFVNYKDFDELLDLKNQYKISKENFTFIDEEDYSEEDNYQLIQPSDSIIVTFDNKMYNKYARKIKLSQYLITDTSFATGCFKWYSDTTKWSIDNFGPLKIPSDNYFVLGDNRHNAMDSRFCGFVKKENITGFVINK